MATSKNDTGFFKKLLVEFIGQEDPILAMLEWTAQQMMQIEAEGIVGAQKGEHSKERQNILFRETGPSHGYTIRHGLSFHSQGPKGRIHSLFHLRAEDDPNRR